jgi:tellurite resistance protein TerC
MDKPLWLWIVFGVVVTFLLAFDLALSRWKSRDLSIKTNLLLSTLYIIVTLIFGGWIWLQLGADLARQFFIGWSLEKTLSLDNVIIMACIFNYFGIPALYQHRVLFWGIMGVIALRAIVICAGVTLVSTFSWILFVFAALLIVMGVKMLFTSNTEPDLSKNKALQFMNKHFRITKELHGNSFFITKIENGKKYLWCTPLLIALVMIECIDIVFAMDSLPAIFAITTDTYIIYTSNIFAILGLRSLYFVLASMIHRFHFINYIVACMLILIGISFFSKKFGFGI